MSQPRPLLHVFLGGVLLALLLGCASRAPEPKPGALTRIVQSGAIRVGTSGEQPPLTMVAKNGELLGLDVALARVLAQSMGVKAEFVQMPFGELLDAVEAHKLDIAMSGITITPERSRRVSFVGPYFTSGKAVLTKSKKIAEARVPQDLDSPDLRFAALKGSTSEEFARRSLSSAKLVLSERLEDAIQAVLKGEVDALVADRETCDFAVLRHPRRGLIAPSVTFTVEPMGIAVAQDEPRLANLVQTYLTALSNSGTLEKARAFWFKDPSWVKDLR